MAITGALSGIAAIRKAAETKGGQDFGDESPFLTLKDGESAKIRFLQEIEDTSSAYDKRRGLALVVFEHSNPKDFRKKAVCTLESEGKCYGCERYEANKDDEVMKRWKRKLRLYANVLVRGVGDTPDKVKILSQGFGGKSISNALLEMAIEFEGVCHQDFKLSRKGSGMNDTEYTIIPLAQKEMTKADKEQEVIPLDKFVKSVGYADQSAFYNAEAADTSEKDNW